MPPIDANGLAVDIRRFGANVDVKFWADSDTTVRVRYYRCSKPGVLPILHSFRFEEEKGLPWQTDPLPGQVGVLTSSASYSKGQRPALYNPDGSYIGTPAQWLTGSTVANPPLTPSLTGESVECVLQRGLIPLLGAGRRQVFDGLDGTLI
jgi:hypothetical protein